MTDNYIAHFYIEDDITHIQSVSTHSRNVARLSLVNSPLSELKTIANLCGILHDMGKYSAEFQDYIRRAMEGETVHRGEVSHSTAGGFLLGQRMPKKHLTQMVQMAVFSHHGLNDSFSTEKGRVFIEDRVKKQGNIQEIESCYAQFVNEETMEKIYVDANADVKSILERIARFIRENNSKPNEYGNKDFFLGMYERTLLSLLIDADWTDTACFMQKRELPEVKSDEEIRNIWRLGITHLENYLKSFDGASRLDQYRREISSKCMEAGKKTDSLYRLTVPTGAGKTLSSLRFALHHAEKYGKRHIIYVAPFQSIIDQNAEVIRKAVGNAEIVLEHHCNVICENQKEAEKYRLLTENWDSPIIVTTAVQFLNTLFAGRNGNIRRMYNILNSVVIFDEVQALPIKITKLYNLAINFLSVFGKSTVVLCSATQPLFDALDENKLLPPINMVGDTGKYEQVFARTKIIDKTEEKKGGFSAGDLRTFVWKEAKRSDQILVIVNTKRCAQKVYEELKEDCPEKKFLPFHLSANMCAANRKQVLEKIEKGLKEKKKLICVSTQLIEAGVDLSFQCVIRSLAGLDSVIQAAGRCNRHGEREVGYVYLIRMAEEEERTESLIDIRIAQDSMQKLLYRFRMQPEYFEGSLASKQAIWSYYQLYFTSRKGEMEFPVSVEGVETTLLDMLSGNTKLWRQMPKEIQINHRKLLLKQAFRTEGDLFKVIPENREIDVVVRYDETANEQINILQNRYITIEEKKQAIRRLQPYTIGISEVQRQRLGGAITAICEGGVLVLSDNYYSRETGVSEEPLGMEFLSY